MGQITNTLLTKEVKHNQEFLEIKKPSHVRLGENNP